MKRNITKKDIESLTDSQKVSLRELWLPEKHDLAIAYICKNAETEEYDEIELVVGDVILNRNHITLVDIRHPKDDNNENSKADTDNDSTDNQEINFDEEFDAEFDLSDEFEDENFEFAYERPTVFSKEDCLPLLSITQMLEIFERRNYRDANFYILAASEESLCEMGNKNMPIDNVENADQSAELCDILWENLKALLL